MLTGYFYCDMDQSIAKLGRRTTPSVFIYHEKGALFQNIVDAAAPTAAKVPTPMIPFMQIVKSQADDHHHAKNRRDLIVYLQSVQLLGPATSRSSRFVGEVGKCQVHVVSS